MSAEQQSSFGHPRSLEDALVDMHLQNLMERGHTLLPDPAEPAGERLVLTCDLEEIRRSVRANLLASQNPPQS